MGTCAFNEMDSAEPGVQLRIDDLAPNGMELSEDELRAVSGGQQVWRRTSWVGRGYDLTTGTGAYS